MALRGKARALLSMYRRNLEVAIIYRVREMSRRPLGHASTNRTVIEHNDCLTLAL